MYNQKIIEEYLFPGGTYIFLFFTNEYHVLIFTPCQFKSSDTHAFKATKARSTAGDIVYIQPPI